MTTEENMWLFDVVLETNRLSQQEKDREAIELLNQRIAQAPSALLKSNLYCLMVHHYVSIAQREGADADEIEAMVSDPRRECYLRAIEVCPEDFQPRLFLAESYLGSGDPDTEAALALVAETELGMERGEFGPNPLVNTHALLVLKGAALAIAAHHKEAAAMLMEALSPPYADPKVTPYLSPFQLMIRHEAALPTELGSRIAEALRAFPIESDSFESPYLESIAKWFESP